MRKVILIGCMVALCLGLAVFGAQAAEKKIVFVDLSRIFDEYNKTKDFDTLLEEKHDGYQKERQKKLDAVRGDEGKLAMLKEEEKKKLQEKIDKAKSELLEFDRVRQTDLRKERDEKIREILLEIEKVVREFAEQEKYDLILNDKVLIFGNETLEITDQVIKLLNGKYQAKK